jgi:hypothetical protein
VTGRDALGAAFGGRKREERRGASETWRHGAAPAVMALGGAPRLRSSHPMIEIRPDAQSSYPDVYTADAIAALRVLAPFDEDRKALMGARLARRALRTKNEQRLAFLDPVTLIARTSLSVQQARDGAFVGSEIPKDLQRQWIQGTGPGARPGVPIEKSIRNVAYALLSGADGWMFDGEDALGQLSTMSLDNQRNLKLAIHRDTVFLKTAEQVAGEMNRWAQGFFGRPIVGRGIEIPAVLPEEDIRGKDTDGDDTFGKVLELVRQHPQPSKGHTSHTYEREGGNYSANPSFIETDD